MDTALVDRLLIAAALTVVVVGVALLIRHLRPDGDATATAGPHGWPLPQHLDRTDFAQPETPWLLAVFTSATCRTCATIRQDAADLASPDLAVVEVEYGERGDLHRKYGIEAVPAVAVVDHDGGVRRWVLGPATPAELREAIDTGPEQVITIRPPDQRRTD